MKLKNHISDNELQRLKDSGWSNERLRIHFNVSKATIKRRLREIAGKDSSAKDQPTLDFAAQLVKLAADAPNGYCAKELRRCADLIRSRHALSRDAKKARVVESLATGALTIDDIAGDLGYKYETGIKKLYAVVKKEITSILDELTAERKVVRRLPGGIGNRGRSPKYQFVLSTD